MNTDEIIEDEVENFVINTEYALLTDPLRNAIRQAIKREREECAKLCEEAIKSIFEFSDEIVKKTARNVCTNLAKGIRARGKE